MLSAIYLYYDLVEPRMVGHVLIPLLSVIPVKEKSRTNIAKRYKKLLYRPILKKNIADIYISIRDDQGQPIRFRKGKVIVMLHLRQKKLNLL